MDREHLLNLRDIEDAYWWHVSKRLMVCELLTDYVTDKGKLLEIGCGAGRQSDELERQGWQVYSSDRSLDAVSFAREKGLRKVMLFDAAKPWPVKTESFAAVIMLDVLEHLESDTIALSACSRVLKAEGCVVLTVPAHQFLFSSWDKMLEHKRRYGRQQLSAIARQSGMKIIKLSYWNAVSFLPAVLLRLGKSKSVGKASAEFPYLPGVVNSLLKGCGWLERKWLKLASIPLGLSMLAVLKKTDSI